MAKLDTWADEHGLPPEPFGRMKQAVIALFADLGRDRTRLNATVRFWPRLARTSPS
jgi:hypothetical protein